MDTRKVTMGQPNQLNLSNPESPKWQGSQYLDSIFKKKNAYSLDTKPGTWNSNLFKPTIFKTAIIPIACTMLLLGVGGWADFANGEVEGSGGSGSMKSQNVAEKQSSEKSKPLSSLRLPIYKPPKGIGAPGGRIGGGSRGQEALALFALVPDHLGLTINNQPTLYWYLSQPVHYPLVLTVNDENQVKPILETILTTTPTAGIHSMPLQNFNIKLDLDREYQWFVSLAVDPENPSKNIIAGGRIQRVLPQEGLLQQLRNAEPHQVTAIYSEAGLWYDALASISDLIKLRPNDSDYRVGRKALLEQVDLMEVAKAEENLTVSQDSSYRNDPGGRSLFATFSTETEEVN